MSCCNQLKQSVKSLALKSGFTRVGITSSHILGGLERFKDFLEAGYHGQMDYLSKNVQKLFCPAMWVPGARSVISMAVSYASGGKTEKTSNQAVGFISRYAQSIDYHRVLKKRLRKLMDSIKSIAPEFEGRAFVDSAPIAERSAGVQGGLGWIGKNGCLIVPGVGSFVFLAEIVCNLELESDVPVEVSCGDCDLCVRSCPTGALRGDGMLDARKCFSYLTIEHRGDVSENLRQKWDRRIFGCDDCQSLCPHNSDIPPGDPELTTVEGENFNKLHQTAICRMIDWSEADWNLATSNSAVRRAPYEVFLRNVILSASHS